MTRIITPGPGSDPNPRGNLTHMRQAAYLVDMERGGGSSPITGRQLAGNLDIVRGSGILGTNFDGVVVDKDGFHAYGDTAARGSYFIRKEDGTLASSKTRDANKGDAAAAGSVVEVLSNDHEKSTIISGGFQHRHSADLVPSSDNVYYLGDDGTGGPSGAGPKRLWKAIFTRKIEFNDGSSFSGNSYSSSRINLTAGENITTRYALYIHTDGKVYHATAAKRSVTIGHARETVSSGATVLVSLNGVFNAAVAGGTITPGDFLHADSVTAGRIINGATFGSGEVLGIAISSGVSGGIVTYMSVKA